MVRHAANRAQVRRFLAADTANERVSPYRTTTFSKPTPIFDDVFAVVVADVVQRLVEETCVARGQLYRP